MWQRVVGSRIDAVASASSEGCRGSSDQRQLKESCEHGAISLLDLSACRGGKLGELVAAGGIAPSWD
jgi:hypothetical protein